MANGSVFPWICEQLPTFTPFSAKRFERCRRLRVDRCNELP
jgi:hypothetical protein